MQRIAALSLCLVFTLLADASAQPAAPPHPLQSTDSRPVPAPPIEAEQRVEHLHRAAEHLEAAGLAQDAERIRTMANAEERARHQERLQEKLGELQAEIAQLKQLVTGPQVMLRVQIIELTHGAEEPQVIGAVEVGDDGDADELVTEERVAPAPYGASFPQKANGPQHCCEGGPGGAPGILQTSAERLPGLPGSQTIVSDDRTKVQQYFRLLENSSDVSIRKVAEPTLILQDGQWGEAFTGGEFDDPAAASHERLGPEEFGVRVRARPWILGGDKLQLDMHVQDRRAGRHRATAGGELVSQGIIGSTASSQIAMRSGETVLFANTATKHSSLKAGQTQESGSEWLVLVTAEIIGEGD